MKLITYQNTRAPAGCSVLVLIVPDGAAEPLATFFRGDDRASLEAKASAWYAKELLRVRERNANALEAAAAAKAKAAARKAAKA